jgi:hypothetical protein
VAKDAVISADATQLGNGGKVIVWGQDTARVHGTCRRWRRQRRQWRPGGNLGQLSRRGRRACAPTRPRARPAPGCSTRGTSTSSAAARRPLHGSPFGSATSGTTAIGADLISESSTNVLLQAKHDITFSSGIFNDAGAT